MTATFGSYAASYDLLYGDKDYAEEASFVDRLVQRHAPGAHALLDLGCGTGRHAAALGAIGYSVHGVDISPDMLALAEQRRDQLQPTMGARLHFTAGDVRSLRLDRTFDAVLSLFHVMSYQIGDADIRAVLLTARCHLLPGGIFVFDYWNGDAVLAGGPQPRTKQVQDERISITREATPVWDRARSLVHVQYKLAISAPGSGETVHVDEVHTMRYLFAPDLGRMLDNAGFACCAEGKWLTEERPDANTWSSYIVAQAR